MKHPAKRVLSYVAINTCALSLNIGIAWAFTIQGMHYLAATVCGFFVQWVITYLANRRITFRSSSQEVRWAYLWAGMVGASSLFLVIATTVVCVEFFSVPFWMARLGSAILAGVWSYCMDSIFTYKRNPFR